MLKIKLARFGKRHQPHFRFVITEARDKRDGQYVVSLGYYAPTAEPKLLELDIKAYDEWLKKGAQPTQTVASLAERVRSGKTHTKKKKISKKAAAKLAKPVEPVAEVAKEAPAEAVEATPAEAPVAEATRPTEEPKVEAETVAPTV